jgi:uroporphyrinogen decarboxylase
MPHMASPFLAACRRRPVRRIPVWFMRQAGRYMPEYRKLRSRYDLLTLCRTPDLAAEVTLQPVRALGVDAAILFTDLLVPLPAMGLRLRFAQGEGPVIENPVRGEKDVGRLRVVDPEEGFPYLFETVRILKAELKVPLIGFAGAPFTLASYIIEGGRSQRFERTKLFMTERPKAWRALMEKLTAVSAASLRAQVGAGADAVQLFDSWVGALNPEEYRLFVLPYSRKALEGVRGPVIHFGTGTSKLLELMREAGGDVIGVDWETPLADAFRRLPRAAIQGNLDPAALLGPLKELRKKVRAILEEAGRRRGFIFNLGHGILPETPVENVKAVVEQVHAFRTGD